MTAETPQHEELAAGVQTLATDAITAGVLEPAAIRCIVVPLDGSLLAERALPVAIALARATGATVRAVHVFVPLAKGTVVRGLVDYAANVEAQLTNDARAYVEDVRRRFQTVEGTKEIVHVDLSRALPIRSPFGEAARIVAALERYARKSAADLIVMTSHGRGGFSRAWMGNVADAAIRGTGLPVLIVRAAESSVVPSIVRHIVIALDGSPVAERVIPVALAIASATHARITLVRVVIVRWTVARASPVAHVDSRDLAKQRAEADAYFVSLRGRMRVPGLAIETQVVDEPVTMLPEVGPVRALLRAIESSSADMIAIATHGYGGAKRWWLGSVADKIVRGAPVATLVMRGESRRGASPDKESR